MSELAPADPTAPTPQRMTEAPLVTITGLEIRLPDGPVLLPETTARIHAGQVTALMGASGSGKTTLLRALIGHLPPAPPRPEPWMSSAARRTSCRPTNCAHCAAPPSPTSARTQAPPLTPA